jgi:hypothetical protein
LTEAQAAKRLDIAIEWGKWTFEDWAHIFFLDESQISLWGSDECMWCHRHPGEAFLPQNFKPKKAFGGRGLMVWGFIMPNGVGHLHQVDGTLDVTAYISILEESFLPVLKEEKINLQSIQLQQDSVGGILCDAEETLFTIKKMCLQIHNLYWIIRSLGRTK